MTASSILYTSALWGHSYIRWAVVLVGLVMLLRMVHGGVSKRPWSRVDERGAVLMVGLCDIQLTLGLLLYLGLSPVVSAGQALGWDGLMADHHLMFFTLFHPALMTLAIFVVHAGRALSKREKEDQGKFVRFGVALVLYTILIALAVPWTLRPLLRGLG